MAKAPIRGEGGSPPPKKRAKKQPVKGGGGGAPTRNDKNKKKAGNNKAKKRRVSPKRPQTNRLLNPPFDARMRAIGSPLNNAKEIKRGWIIGKESKDRVNFLFNPSQIDIQAGIDPAIIAPDQAPNTGDVTDTFYTSTGMALSVKLLFDRTYELYSNPGNGQGTNAAHKFGVYADVGAFFILLGMLDDLPTTWDETFIISPPYMMMCYLFIGPRQAYYGFINSISVTYSHWSQDMVPVRCSVDLSFSLVPHTSAESSDFKNVYNINSSEDYIKGAGWGTYDFPEHGGIPAGVDDRPDTTGSFGGD